MISENKLPYPFDLNHVAISGYTHLGDAIDYDEVLRFRKILGDTLHAVLEDHQKQKPDSPVYTFLSQLIPPALGREVAHAVARAGQALEQAGETVADAAANARAHETEPEDPTLATLIEQGEQAIQGNEFLKAKALFAAALQLGKDKRSEGAIAHDPYLIQRLALVTYKSKQPDEIAALNEALTIVDQLNPKDSNDPETVGLAGAIEKRFFDKGQGDEHLDRAIGYYGRGYFLRNDWYNGINLAYLLNVRTTTALDATNEEQIADLVWANRIRRQVLALCEQDLRAIDQRERQLETTLDSLRDDHKARDKERKFWCLATKAEAYFGLGQLNAYEKSRLEAQGLEHADWMMETFDGQIGRLRTLLEKHGHLLNPQWPKLAAATSQAASGMR